MSQTTHNRALVLLFRMRASALHTETATRHAPAALPSSRAAGQLWASRQPSTLSRTFTHAWPVRHAHTPLGPAQTARRAQLSPSLTARPFDGHSLRPPTRVPAKSPSPSCGPAVLPRLQPADTHDLRPSHRRAYTASYVGASDGACGRASRRARHLPSGRDGSYRGRLGSAATAGHARLADDLRRANRCLGGATRGRVWGPWPTQAVSAFLCCFSWKEKPACYASPGLFCYDRQSA